MKELKPVAAVVAGSLVLLAIVAGASAEVVTPGTILYDFDSNVTSNGYVCDPDNWNFFGAVTTDFGSDLDAQDGHGAFIAGNWTLAAGWGMGAGVGIGPFPAGQPLCGAREHGIGDINKDLSLGTGVTMLVKLRLPPGDFPPDTAGTPGVKLQFQLLDDDGTEAVIPGSVFGKPWVKRTYAPVEAWEKVTFYLAGLDSSFDDAAVGGTIPGLDLNNIHAIRLIWRRGATSANSNVLHWDEIKLIDTPPVLWGDRDNDGDVDLKDFAMFQECLGINLTPDHPETVLFDFQNGAQGWTSFGDFTTESGMLAGGSVGQGRYHVADFDAPVVGWGIGDISPVLDLSSYTGMKVDLRLVDVAGHPAFSGWREFDFILEVGAAKECKKTFDATNAYATYSVNFSELNPQPAAEELAAARIKLIVRKIGSQGTNSGTVELDYDQVTAIATVPSDCKSMDADLDNDVDLDDSLNLSSCLQGPAVTAGFYPWCY